MKRGPLVKLTRGVKSIPILTLTGDLAWTSSTPGEDQVGAVLTVTSTPTANIEAATLAITWQRDDLTFTGEEGASHVHAPDDVGLTVRPKLTAVYGPQIVVVYGDWSGEVEAASPTEGVSLASSVTYRSITYTFNKPAYVGRYLGSTTSHIPFVIREADDSLTITAISPASASVTSSSYSRNGVTIPATGYMANGAMVDPLIPFQEGVNDANGWTDADVVQGFDGMLETWQGTSQSSTVIPYVSGLNVDPGATGQPIVLDREMSVVKSVRRTGLTTPNQDIWRHFEDWGVLHVLDAAPPTGAYPPCVSNPNKTSAFTTANINKAVLGAGFDLTGTGVPTLAASVTAQYFHTNFQPFFGMFGHGQRRFMINPGLDGNDSAGYSRDYALIWADYLLGMLAEGEGADDAEFQKAITFGIQLYGLWKMGVYSANGAGQQAGYLPFLYLLAMAGHEVEPELLTCIRQMQGNETGQQFWIHAGLIGQQQYYGQPDGTGLPYYYGGNHQHNFCCYEDEHLGRPGWITELEGGRPARSTLWHDSKVDSDYALNSGGVANFPGQLAICLMQDGPNGWDGSRLMANAASIANATVAFAAEEAASLAYMDRHRTFVDGGDTVYESGALVVTPRHQAVYDLKRDDCQMPRWAGAPEAPTPHYSLQSMILTAGAGKFVWDLSDIHNATETVGDWEIQYALINGSDEAVQFVDVDTPGETGEQTGLQPGYTYQVRWRRHSASGWSEWSNTWKRQYSDSGVPGRVTPTGTPSSAAPTNTVAPVIHIKSYPAWWGPRHEPAPPEIDLETHTVLYAGLGMRTGNIGGTYTYQWKRDGSSITGATSASYAVTTADLGATLTCTVTPPNGGTPVTTAGVVVPARPAQPATLIFESDFNAEFPLYYPLTWASIQANSASVTLEHRDSYTVYDDGDPIADGTIRGIKTSSNPSLQGDFGADYPLTIGQTYRVTVKVLIQDLALDSNRNTRAFASPAKYTSNTGTPAAGYYRYSGNLARDPQPRVETFIWDIVATATTMWIRVTLNTATGGTGGGNPQLDYVKIEKIS